MSHKAHCNHVGRYTQSNFSIGRMCTVGYKHQSTCKASPRKVIVQKSPTPAVAASIGAVKLAKAVASEMGGKVASEFCVLKVIDSLAKIGKDELHKLGRFNMPGLLRMTVPPIGELNSG